MAQGLFDYLLGKRSEVADLDVKDAVLAKVVLDIHRKRTHKTTTWVPLFALRPIHRLDRDNALASTERRVATLFAHHETLRQARRISSELLAEHLPSVSWVKVVEHSPGTFVAFEGNGRLAALQVVFSPDDGIELEVEQYHFEPGDRSKMVRRLDRVRKLNALLADDASMFGDPPPPWVDDPRQARDTPPEPESELDNPGT